MIVYHLLNSVQLMNVGDVLETCLYVDNLETAEELYAETLGRECFRRVRGRHAFFECGIATLLLFVASESKKGGSIPAHGTDGPGHVAFRVSEEELDSWCKHLHRHGVELEKDLEWPRVGRSSYFRDPAGNSLELAAPEVWSVKSG